MKRAKLAVAALFVVSLLAAGCGSSAEDKQPKAAENPNLKPAGRGAPGGGAGAPGDAPKAGGGQTKGGVSKD